MSGGEDSVGVFVPRWAMDECGGDPRDAMVLAQVTWWLQPSQRTGTARHEAVIERDGILWLAMTDERLGREPGLSADQVYRAKSSLRKRGLIETQVRKVDGTRCTLTRPARNREVAVSETATSRNSQTATPRFEPNRDSAVSIPIVNNPSKNGKEPSTATAAEAPRADTGMSVLTATSDPVKKRAWDLARLAMEQPVKPVIRGGNPFPAVMALVERELRSGRPVGDLERAITAGVDVWTQAGLQTAVAKAREKRRRRGGDDPGAVAMADWLERGQGQ